MSINQTHRCTLAVAVALLLFLALPLEVGCGKQAEVPEEPLYTATWPSKLSEAEMIQQEDKFLAAWFGTPHLRNSCEDAYQRARPKFDPATVLRAYRLAPPSTREPGFLSFCSDRWNDAYFETVAHTAKTNEGYRESAVSVLVQSGSAAAHRFVLEGLAEGPEWFVSGAAFGTRQSRDSIFAGKALKILEGRNGLTPAMERSIQVIRNYAKP